MRFIIPFFIVFFHCCNVLCAQKACHPLLWPVGSAINNTVLPISQGTVTELQQWSDKLLQASPNPIVKLNSSGKTNIKDLNLIATREALQDADHAVLLALTYRLTHNSEYLYKTSEILLSWSSVNHPTGNPIDENRLDGMIWAYDLISCDLSDEIKAKILNWFERMRIKKVAWKFGPKTDVNNYRIHQLKMLLLLDKILQRKQDWEEDVANAKKYSQINLMPSTGMSIDYLERSALYYHNYVMQPWLEISLITGCCQKSVKQGFAFLRDKILSHDIQHEFSHSHASIDKLRAKGGFAYAKTEGVFDVKKATPTFIRYYTLVKTHPDPKLWAIQQATKISPSLLFLKVRRFLWQA